MTSCPALCSHHRSKGQGVFHFYFFISTFYRYPRLYSIFLREPEILHSYHPLWITVWKTDPTYYHVFHTINTCFTPKRFINHSASLIK